MSQQNETLEKDIKNLQENFNEILTSGVHYVTNEITNHIKHINNGLDNIKLDYEFQRGSKNWSKQFDSNEIKLNETNIQQLVFQGQNLTRELNTCLHKTTVQNKEENQLRELHNWACNSLIDYIQNLQPYASSSYARLDNIAHHLGVTDRYIGYRHNLTRNGNQPLNVHTVWADRKLPRVSTAMQQSSTPDWKNYVQAYRHYGPSVPTTTTNQQTLNSNSKLFGYLRPAQQTSEQKRPMTTPNYGSRAFSSYNNNDPEREAFKAGINLVFPGRTEYMERYNKPEQLLSAPFTPNPQPNFSLTGRPLARLVPESYNSEYSRTYGFPDASKVEKFPWLRSY